MPSNFKQWSLINYHLSSVQMCRCTINCNDINNCYYFHYTSLLFFVKNLIVGKDAIFMSSSSLAVASIFAMTMSERSLNFSPSSSQIGASCLQWPHHGASTTTIHTVCGSFPPRMSRYWHHRAAIKFSHPSPRSQWKGFETEAEYQLTKIQSTRYRFNIGLQCFDAVGWASGRASGL